MRKPSNERSKEVKLRRTLILSLALALALGGTAAGADTIKIGALMPLTGPLAPFGPSIVNGAQLAIDQINAAGGVLGKQLELAVGDTATSPTVARDATSKLVNIDMVPAIVGAVSDDVTLAVSSVIVPAEVVLISPASPSFAIPALDDNDYVFRTAVSCAAQGVYAARLAFLLHYSKVSVLYVNNAYGKEMAQTFKGTFEAYVHEVSAMVPCEPNKPSYRGETEKAMSGNPDAIFMVSYPMDGNKQIVELLEAGYQSDFLFSATMMGEGVAPGLTCPSAEAPGPIEGAYGTAAATGFRIDQFKADYEDRFKPSSAPYHYEAYDAVMLVVLAMVKAGEATGTAIRENLRAVANPPGEKVFYGEWEKAVSLLKAGKEINYQGVSGEVDLDNTGCAIWRATPGGASVWKIEGCHVVPVRGMPGCPAG